MTAEEIRVLSGRALDAAVEERVFGRQVRWVRDSVDGHEYPQSFGRPGWARDEWHRVPDYRQDLGEAWVVVEEVQRRGELPDFLHAFAEALPTANAYSDPVEVLGDVFGEVADDLADRICRVALTVADLAGWHR